MRQGREFVPSTTLADPLDAEVARLARALQQAIRKAAEQAILEKHQVELQTTLAALRREVADTIG